MSRASNKDLRSKGNDTIQGFTEDEQTTTVRRRHLPVAEGLYVDKEFDNTRYFNDNPNNLQTRSRMALEHHNRKVLK